MTPEEHYTKAEYLLGQGSEMAYIKAQVHATLALAAATSEIAKQLSKAQTKGETIIED